MIRKPSSRSKTRSARDYVAVFPRSVKAPALLGDDPFEAVLDDRLEERVPIVKHLADETARRRAARARRGQRVAPASVAGEVVPLDT